MSKRTLWLAMSLLMIFAMAGTVAAAPPAPPVPGMQPQTATAERPQDHPIIGTVTHVEAGSLTVEGGDGRTFTFALTEETRYIVPDVVDPALDDIHEGDRVRVTARRDGGADLPRAILVAVVPEDTAFLRGEITVLGTGSFTLETRLEQEIAVTVNDATLYFVPGDSEADSVQALRAGDRVEVIGRWVDAETFHGWIVRVDRRSRLGRALGRVLTVGESEFTLGTPDGVITVQVNEETRYRVPGETQPDFTAVEEGALVAAAGEKLEDGSLLARIVTVGSQAWALRPR